MRGKIVFRSFLVVLLLVFAMTVHGNPYAKPRVQNLTRVPRVKCKLSDAGPTNASEGMRDCGEGVCQEPAGTDGAACVCLEPYMSTKDMNVKGSKISPCSYFAAKKKDALFYSLFLGFFGADWFYLSRCCAKRALVTQLNKGYICVGFFKLFTFGGLGLWWLVDIFLILFDVFQDGNGMPLWNDL